MSDEAKQALAQRSDVRAEYEAEFESEAGEGVAGAIVKVEELQALLGPSQRERNNAIVLAFRKRIKDAEREVEEMQSREVAYQMQNKAAVEHNAKLAAERDHWRDLKDPERVVSALTEERDKLKVELADALERLEKTKAVAPGVLLVTPRPWWKFWGKA